MKLKWDERLGVLRVKRVLAAGSCFPFDFGCVPGTVGSDGDPLDVLLFLDASPPPGSLVPFRLVGVIEAVQSNVLGDGRNDRLLGVGCETFAYEHFRDIADVPKILLDEIENFFASYLAREGVRFVAQARRGVDDARALLRRGQERLRSVAVG